MDDNERSYLVGIVHGKQDERLLSLYSSLEAIGTKYMEPPQMRIYVACRARLELITGNRQSEDRAFYWGLKLSLWGWNEVGLEMLLDAA